jgi:hypothetical protein
MHDKELVDIILSGLSTNWIVFRQMILGRDNLPLFSELETLMLLEDGRKALDTKDKALFIGNFVNRGR